MYVSIGLGSFTSFFMMSSTVRLNSL
jgi:hypothetical protein